MNALELRKELKSKKPSFVRQDFGKKKRIKKNWRKPRGIDSKVRLQLRGRSKIVKEGYSSPKEVRFTNKDGFKEIMLGNVSDLANVKEGCIGVISSTVGKRKRSLIVEEAKKLNVKLQSSDSIFKKISNFLDNRKTVKKAREAKKAVVAKAKKAVKKEEKVEKVEEKDAKDAKKEKDKILTKKGSM